MSAAGDGIQRSLADAATERIRAEILSGRIRPGERIRLKTLEELLDVSHIPIREALRRLEGEGLVQNIPQRGAIATPLSLEELADVYELRKLVESYAARRALPLPAERIKAVVEALEEMHTVPDEWASPAFPNLHRKFHWLILEQGVTPTMEQVIRQLWQTSERYVRFAMIAGSGARVAARHHKRLLTTIRSGDGDALASELVEHLEFTESGVRTTLERNMASLVLDP